MEFMHLFQIGCDMDTDSGWCTSVHRRVSDSDFFITIIQILRPGWKLKKLAWKC